METVEVNLPDSLLDWLEEHAEENDISFEDLIHQVVGVALLGYARDKGYQLPKKAPATPKSTPPPPAQNLSLVDHILIVLRDGPKTASQVRAKVGQDLHQTTVQSALYRLEEKGLVKRTETMKVMNGRVVHWVWSLA